LRSGIVGIPEVSFRHQLLQLSAGMSGQLRGVFFGRLLAFGSELGYPDGEKRSIFLEHPKQALRTINLGVNRKHCGLSLR